MQLNLPLTPDDDTLDNKINVLGLNAPRLTPDLIKSKIKNVHYVIMPSGKTMICEIELLNGFTVRGEASVVSKDNFNKEIGEDISFKNAFSKIWELEGYLLQERVFNGN